MRIAIIARPGVPVRPPACRGTVAVLGSLARRFHAHQAVLDEHRALVSGG